MNVSNRAARNALLAVMGASMAVVLTAAFVSASPVRWVTLALVLVNGIVCLVPFWLEAGRTPFDPFHPLVFLFFVYWVPMVLVKGSQLALGGDSGVLLRTPDPLRSLNLALLYSGLGWLSTVLGFYSPVGAFVARRLHFPRWAASRNLIGWLPLVVVFAVGVLFNVALIKHGAFGSSLTEAQAPLLSVSILRPLSLWPLMVSFIVAFMVGRSGRSPRWLLFFLVALGTLIAFAALSGSRAYLFQVVLALACAHTYGRGLGQGSKALVLWLGTAVLALILGTAVMSEYRSLRFMRYGEGAMSLSETVSTVKGAVREIFANPMRAVLEGLPQRLSERFSSIELLGTTIGLADAVRSEERDLGMEGNIAKEIAWAFVPRPLWPAKPQLSEFGYSFAYLYLGIAGHTSAAPSMIGDLFRNFRVAGILVGMFIFGLYLRAVYAVLVLQSPGEVIAAAAYWFLLAAVSLEGTYLSFFSSGTRNLFALGGILAVLLVGRAVRLGARRT